MPRNLFDEIAKDLREYASNVAKFAAIEAREELADTAAGAIESFYAHYEPMDYYRNYYNFRQKSYKKYYKNSHGKSFSGGITLTPENMDELYMHPTVHSWAKNETWGAPAEVVFHTVMDGWHGLPSPYEVTSPMEPSPMELIQKRYDELCANPSRLIQRAEQKAKKIKYKYL